MKQFKVKIWLGANPTEVTVTAKNSLNAMQVAKKLFPVAKVINAKSK